MVDEKKEIKIEEPKEELSLPQMISEIHNIVKPKEDGKKKKKVKEFKIPAKGRVSKSKAAKGFVTIMKIEENRNVAFEKQKLDMEVTQTKDGIYHASDGREVLFYKGKPLILQPSWTQNPFHPFDKTNNVYGQKPILARMQSSVYTGEKKKGGFGGIVWILAIVVGGYLLAHYVLKIF